MSDGVLDLDALKRLLNVIGGDIEDLDELREEYLETAPEIMAAMTAAADAGDMDALRVAAHSLKGNAKDFGAVSLAELCGALEARCKSGEDGDTTGEVAAIAVAEAEARSALEALEHDNLG